MLCGCDVIITARHAQVEAGRTSPQPTCPALPCPGVSFLCTPSHVLPGHNPPRPATAYPSLYRSNLPLPYPIPPCTRTPPHPCPTSGCCAAVSAGVGARWWRGLRCAGSACGSSQPAAQARSSTVAKPGQKSDVVVTYHHSHQNHRGTDTSLATEQWIQMLQNLVAGWNGNF